MCRAPRNERRVRVGEIAGLTASVLGYIDQYFSYCAVLNGLVRLGCVCQREPVQRQADVLAYG